MKKTALKILSHLLVLTLFTGMVSFVSAQAAQIPSTEAYTITDTSYSPELGIYVVVTKNLDNTAHPCEILFSENGETWKKAMSLSNAKHYGNPNTRQTVVWWEKEQKFVAILGGNVYVSEDGKTWSANNYLKTASRTNSNTILETNGEQLIINKEYVASVFDSIDGEPLQVEFAKSGTYGKSVGIAASDLADRYVVFDGWQQWRIDETGEFSLRSITTGSMYDLQYSSLMNGWFITGPGMQAMFFDNELNSFTKMDGLSLADGMTETDYITAMAASGSYILAGVTNGDLYVAPEEKNSLSSECMAWESVVPMEGTEKIEEDIRSISVIDEDIFFFGSRRAIYKAVRTDNGWCYYDITSSHIMIPEELRKVEVPESGSINLNIIPQSLTWTGEPSANKITSVSLIGNIPSGIEASHIEGGYSINVSSSVEGGHTLTFRVITQTGQQQDIDVEIINQDRVDVDGYDELVIPEHGEGDKQYKFSAVVIGTDGNPMSRVAAMDVLSLPNGVDFDAQSGIFTVHETANGGKVVLEVYTVAQPEDKVRKEISITPRHVMYVEITDSIDSIQIPDEGTEQFTYKAVFYDQVKKELKEVDPVWTVEAKDISSLDGISINA